MITGDRVPRHRRLYAVAILACALALAASLLARPAPAAAGPSAPAASSSATPWPSSPNWQSYVETPGSSNVCPQAIQSTSGTVSGAQNLVCGGSGGATLTMTSGGATPAIVLDYGREAGGVPYFTVSAESGSPKLQAGYSEGLNYLSATGDGATPWAEGDTSRADTYTVTGPGTIANAQVQGGERYEEITLTSPGTVTLSAAGLTYIADRSNYQGYFVSSSDELNKIWADSAYTAQIASFPSGTTAYPAGTIGFREYSAEEADFRNLTVTSSSGSSLYSSPLNASSDLSDFAVPGVNSLPSILDGAKRDRAIWAGDMNVEGPSVYYSTDQTQYIKGALQLLGSYQLSSGFIFAAQEWPVVQAELAWNASQLDANGLLVTNSSDGNDWDYYDGAKTQCHLA